MGTLTLNSSCKASPKKQREDEPICIFVSTFVPKGGHKNRDDVEYDTWKNYIKFEYPNSEGVNHCKWYVLDTENQEKVEEEEEKKGECPISMEIKKQFFPSTKKNFGLNSPIFLNQKKRARMARKAKMGKKANYRFKELLGLPSSLPYNFNARRFQIFNFNSRICFYKGMVRIGHRFCKRNVLIKDFYCLNTLSPSPEQDWKKASSNTPSLMTVAYSDHKIYGLGKDTKEYLCIWVLDLDSWRRLSKAPSSLEKIGNVVTVGVLEFGTKILFFSYKSDQLFYYNIKRNSWSILADNFTCWNGRLTVALGCVFCFKGYYLRAYDLTTLQWLPIKGLISDGDIMPSINDPNECEVCSVDLFLVNHNKLALFWDHLGDLHCSKFFIHKTPNYIRATPSFCLCLTVHITRSVDLPVCVPLNGSCFGLRDVDYYEEEEGRRELMLEGAQEVQGQESESCFDMPDWLFATVDAPVAPEHFPVDAQAFTGWE